MISSLLCSLHKAPLSSLVIIFPGISYPKRDENVDFAKIPFANSDEQLGANYKHIGMIALLFQQRRTAVIPISFSMKWHLFSLKHTKSNMISPRAH